MRSRSSAESRQGMAPAPALGAVRRPALFALRNGALLAASAAVAGLVGGTIVATGSLVGLAMAAGSSRR